MIEDPQSAVTEINGCISQASKRQHGLLKLAIFAERCQLPEHQTLLEKSTPFWIKTLLQIFESHPVTIHAKLAHYCFYLLIQCSKNASPELARIISTNFVEKAITVLTKSNEQLSKNALMCLDELIENYRGPCSQHKQKIETFVLNKLDSDSDDVVDWACKCYAKLPYLHKSQTSTDMWYIYFKNMIKNGNNLLNDIFEEHQPAIIENVQDNDDDFVKSHTGNSQQADNSINSSTLNKSERLFSKLDKTDDLDAYFQKLLKRFRACCLAMGYMFEPLDQAVIIKIRSVEIIEFLKRLYTFDFKKLNLTRIHMETKCLCEIISDLYNYTLKFTVKFFKVLRTNLLTNSNQISQLLSHFAASLKENMLFYSISTYYECLTEWMKSVGPNSGFNKYSTGIIESILLNIKPIQKNVLTLETAKHFKEERSIVNKSKNDSGNYFFHKTVLNTHQQQKNSEIICSALDCLASFIRNFNQKSSFSQFEKIQQTLIEIILCTQNNTTCLKPYDQVACRLSLYKNLYELCHSQNNRLAPPLAISISLLRTGLQDNSNEIRSFSQQSLITLRAFVCPIMPVYLKEYEITQQQQQTHPLAAVSNTEQTISSNSTFSMTSSASNILVKTSLPSTENNILKQTQQLQNGSIFNNNTNKLNNMTNNNSLVDMKNSLNIQEGNNSLKRKSPIDIEDQIKAENGQVKKFAGNLNYKSALHKENDGRDSEGNGLEEEDDEDDLELINSEDDEIDEDDFDEGDDEEYDEEDEDLVDEIDLEDEEGSIKEATNTKDLAGQILPTAEKPQSNRLSSPIVKTPINVPETNSSDINKLLKSTGDYDEDEDDDDDEEDEDEDSKMVEEEDSNGIYLDDEDEESENEELVEDEDDKSENEIELHQKNNQETNNEVLAAVAEATSNEIMNDAVIENASVEAAVEMNQSMEQDYLRQAVLLEQELMDSTQNKNTEENIPIAEENITNDDNTSNEVDNDKDEAIQISEKDISLVADYEDKSSENEKVPVDMCEPVVLPVDKQLFIENTESDVTTSKIEIEEACAEFKVDAVITKNCYEYEEVKVE